MIPQLPPDRVTKSTIHLRNNDTCATSLGSPNIYRSEVLLDFTDKDCFEMEGLEGLFTGYNMTAKYDTGESIPVWPSDNPQMHDFNLPTGIFCP